MAAEFQHNFQVQQIKDLDYVSVQPGMIPGGKSLGSGADDVITES